MVNRFAEILFMLRPKRRWAQFSLVGLLTFIAILCAPLGWLGSKLESKRRERAAEAAIQSLGALVIRNDSPIMGFFYEDPEEESGTFRGPEWLKGVLGEDFFAHAVCVYFRSDDRLTDADLVHLEQLPFLKVLNLSCPELTDAGLIHLSRLVLLRDLMIESPHVSDAGLMCLKGMTSLETLDLKGTQVSDHGLVHLDGFTRLLALSVAATKVTDAGLVHLQGLNRLQWLSIDRTKITDGGLAHLQKLSGLHHLSVLSTKTTDDGVAELQYVLPDCEVRR